MSATPAPWQKGGSETAIGRLRRPLPRTTDWAALSEAGCTPRVPADHNTPRKCLGYQTLAEIFRNHMLHFKCEATFPLLQE